VSRLLTRAAVVTATSLTALGLAVAPAFAHVTVHSDGPAVQGGYSELAFRVPNEQDHAGTTRVQVLFPTDAPIASVAVKPHPGWHYQVQTRKLATPIRTDDGRVTQTVSAITWTADSPATALQPGQFDDFDVSAGPLPKTAAMTFKAIQTYSNGDVVRWIDTAAPGAPEPDHPAPVLHLTSGTDSTSAQPGGSDPTAASRLTATRGTGASNGGGTNRALAIAALVVAVAAAAASGLSLARRRAAA
jgi:uncharacterized protein